MTLRLVAVKCNLRNYRIGESNHNAKHTDALVKAARQMHASGATSTAIAKELCISRRTVRSWLDKTRRAQPWVKVRMVRVYD